MRYVVGIHCTEAYAHWFRKKLVQRLNVIVWCHDPARKAPTLYRFSIEGEGT